MEGLGHTLTELTLRIGPRLQNLLGRRRVLYSEKGLDNPTNELDVLIANQVVQQIADHLVLRFIELPHLFKRLTRPAGTVTQHPRCNGEAVRKQPQEGRALRRRQRLQPSDFGLAHDVHGA
jgi:hypothetical protein